MKFLHRGRVALFIGLLALLSIGLAACKPDASADIISPGLGERMIAARTSGAVVAAEPTPMPVLADLTPEEIYAGLPDDVLAAVQNADPAAGETLALSNGCVGCHSLDPAAQMTGPTWYNIGNTAVSRVPGESPAAYLYHSIIEPNAHVVEGYPQGIMPQTYADSLSVDDLGTLVAYLLSQQQGGE
ncbi:MAG: c-type cytochrome [Caldilineaceae bacterium]|nr:c-type cytochrome [Caldilineaceae bacterium]